MGSHEAFGDGDVLEDVLHADAVSCKVKVKKRRQQDKSNLIDASVIKSEVFRFKNGFSQYEICARVDEP